MPDSLPAVVQQFDYDAVPATHRKTLKETAGAIRAALRRTVKEMLAIGEALHRSRILLEGQFQAWVEAEIGMSARTARLFMAAADRFNGKAEMISALTPTAVLRLASAPEEAVAEIVQRTKRGEKVRVADVERIVRAARIASGDGSGAGSSVGPAPTSSIQARGKAGLTALCDRARDEAVPRFLARLGEVIDHFEAAAAVVAAGKRPQKGALQEATKATAIWLSAELRRMTDRVPPDAYFGRSPLEHAQHDSEPWMAAAIAIEKIASARHWDSVPAAHLAPWVVSTLRALRHAAGQSAPAAPTAPTDNTAAKPRRRKPKAKDATGVGEHADGGVPAAESKPTASGPAGNGAEAADRPRPSWLPKRTPEDAELGSVPVFLRPGYKGPPGSTREK